MTTKEKCLKALDTLGVTPTDVTKRITSETYNFVGTTTTCYLTLDHVHVVSGTSYCANPSRNNPQIGKNTAFEKAFDRAFEIIVALEKAKAISEIKITDYLYPDGVKWAV